MIIKDADHGEIVSNLEVHKQQYGIRSEDVSHIIDLLRTKLYVNPLLAMCREVISNCRDANREAGRPKADIAFNVDTEPLDGSSPYMEFCDSGDGISPSRLKDIYLNFGASTKRNNNKQTGGFGLGAKSPSAYTDTFYIITVSEGILYTYTSTIVGSNTGSVVLMDERQALPGEVGTTIRVPLKEKVHSQLATGYIKAMTYFWEVPISINGVPNKRTKGDIVYFPKSKCGYGVSEYVAGIRTTCSLYAVVDGLPYPIVNFEADAFFRESGKVGYLFFKTGELQFIPSRDGLLESDNVKERISKKLEALKEDVIQQATAELSSMTYMQKLVYYLSREMIKNNVLNGADYAHPSMRTNYAKHWLWKKVDLIKNADLNQEDLDILRGVGIARLGFGNTLCFADLSSWSQLEDRKAYLHVKGVSFKNRSDAIGNTLIFCGYTVNKQGPSRIVHLTTREMEVVKRVYGDYTDLSVLPKNVRAKYVRKTYSKEEKVLIALESKFVELFDSSYGTTTTVSLKNILDRSDTLVIFETGNTLAKLRENVYYRRVKGLAEVYAYQFASGEDITAKSVGLSAFATLEKNIQFLPNVRLIKLGENFDTKGLDVTGYLEVLSLQSYDEKATSALIRSEYSEFSPRFKKYSSILTSGSDRVFKNSTIKYECSLLHREIVANLPLLLGMGCANFNVPTAMSSYIADRVLLFKNKLLTFVEINNEVKNEAL